RHFAKLTRALDEHETHPLRPRVGKLAAEIRAALEALPGPHGAPLPVAHGDLKLNNLLFEEHAEGPRVVALIDLDTIAPMQLAHEMGDALRSWANVSGEDDTEARIDLEACARAGRAYLQARAQEAVNPSQDSTHPPAPTSTEIRDAFVHGPELISAELAARFATDALEETYFGWDHERFERAGAHNLVRAEGQWSLHLAFADTRAARRLALEDAGAP